MTSVANAMPDTSPCSPSHSQGEVVDEQPKFGDTLKRFQELQQGKFLSKGSSEEGKVTVGKLVLPISLDPQPIPCRRSVDVETDPVLAQLRNRNRLSNRSSRRSVTPDSDDSSWRESSGGPESTGDDVSRSDRQSSSDRAHKSMSPKSDEDLPRKTSDPLESDTSPPLPTDDDVIDEPANNSSNHKAPPETGTIVEDCVTKNDTNGNIPKKKTKKKSKKIVTRSILKTVPKAREVLLESTNFQCQSGLQHAEPEILATDGEDTEDEVLAGGCHDDTRLSSDSESEDQDDEEEEDAEDIDFYEVPGLCDASAFQDCDNGHRSTKVQFSTRPIRVFRAHSPNEYNRSNPTVQPHVSALEYELERRLEGLQILDVTLNKGSAGLGIKVMGVGQEAGVQRLGIFIKEIVPGGTAELDGQLQTCDQIVEVNGVSLVGVEKDFASNVLRSTDGIVHFRIGREHDPANSDILRLVEVSKNEVHRKRSSDEADSPYTADDGRTKRSAACPLEVVVEELSQLGSPVKTMNPLPCSLSDSGLHQDNTDFPFMDAEGAADILECGEAISETLDMAEADLSSAMTATSVDQSLYKSLTDAVARVRDRYQQLERVAAGERQRCSDLVDLLEEERTRCFDLEETKGSLETRLTEMSAVSEEMRKKGETIQAQLDEKELELSSYRDLMEGAQGQNIRLEEMTKKYKKVKRLLKETQVSEKNLRTEKETLQGEVDKKDTYITYIKETVTRLQTEVVALQDSAADKVCGLNSSQHGGSNNAGKKLTPDGDKRMDQIFDSHPSDSTIRKPIRKKDFDGDVTNSTDSGLVFDDDINDFEAHPESTDVQVLPPLSEQTSAIDSAIST